MPNRSTVEQTSPRKKLPRLQSNEPLMEYALLSGVFLVVTAVGYKLLRRRHHAVPKIEPSDLLLLGLATNRLSRLITRDKVARPVRAPFTEVDPTAPPGVPREHPRGKGFTKAIGELVTCPRCAAVWGSAGLCLAFAWSPPLGRFVSILLSSAAISDYVNRRYTVLMEKSLENSQPQKVSPPVGDGAGLAPIVW